MLNDGHRLFPTSDPSWWAIADNSGREPQDTDDGILWLDFDWNLIISSPENALCIPVKRERDNERFSTVTNLSTLLSLSQEFEWPIEDQNTGTIYSVTKEN
jgi:hypothetical protein